MKKAILILVLMLCLVIIIGTACATVNARDVIYQAAPFIALQEGDFDGDYKCGDLKQYGDYGLGTIDNLDGEMVMVEGNIYHMRIDGIAYPVNDSVETPWATVTFFEPDKTIQIDSADSYSHFQQLLDASLPTENTFYAVRIEGTFDYIKARTVPAQSEPYPTLVEAVEDQAVFEFNNTPGTLFGFRCPPYIGPVNVPGYHFHFITADRKAGGHLLDCRMHDMTAEIDETNSFQLIVPTNQEFMDINLSEQDSEEVEKIEK
jgi:acetolactate decarboxylase